jgi:WD40 repeat protein
LWDASNGAELRQLKTSADLPGAVFGPSAGLVLTATNDNVAHLLSTAGQERKDLVGHKDHIAAAAFSTDGKLVATGSLDSTGRLWSVGDVRRLQY